MTAYESTRTENDRQDTFRHQDDSPGYPSPIVDEEEITNVMCHSTDDTAVDAEESMMFRMCGELIASHISACETEPKEDEIEQAAHVLSEHCGWPLEPTRHMIEQALAQ